MSQEGETILKNNSYATFRNQNHVNMLQQACLWSLLTLPKQMTAGVLAKCQQSGTPLPFAILKKKPRTICLASRCWALPSHQAFSF